MKPPLNYLFCISVSFALGVLVLSLRVPGVFHIKRDVRILEAPIITNTRITGELVAGSRVEQEFTIKPSAGIERLITTSDTVCINLYMTDYDNRKSKGHCRVLLQSNGRIGETVLDYATVRRDAFHQVCFDDVKAIDLINRTNRLVLIVEDGQHGESVTAWTTWDRRFDVATVNGDVKNRCLVFSVAVKRNDVQRFASVLGLLLFSSLLVGMLACAGMSSCVKDSRDGWTA